MLRMNTLLSVPLTPYVPQKPAPTPAKAEPTRAPMRIPARVFVEPARDSAPITPRSQVIVIDDFSLPVVGIPTASVVGVPSGQTPQVIAMLPPPPRPPEPPVVKPSQAPVTVTSELQAAKILHKVVPAYPPLAKQARIQGTVRLMGVIAKDGTIQQLKIVSGHPLLVQAAFDAVKQWTYRPTILNKEAVEVIAPIDVIFTLSN